MARLRVVATFNACGRQRSGHTPGLVKTGELKGKKLQDALDSAFRKSEPAVNENRAWRARSRRPRWRPRPRLTKDDAIYKGG